MEETRFGIMEERLAGTCALGEDPFGGKYEVNPEDDMSTVMFGWLEWVKEG